MDLWNALKVRLGLAPPEPADATYQGSAAWPVDEDRPDRDVKRLLLVIGLGALSWVATYVGMLELIEANLGDLPFVHKIIIGFSVAMLMTMIIWLLDKMFAPIDSFTRACYIAGYVFLSVISVGFGFGFYWKVLESRGEASRSAESAITQVQSSLFAASTRLEQLQSTLDQLTTVSSEKSEVERSSGKSCPNSGPGDGPRRKMREDDAARFKFSSDFVKGRVATVKSDMAALDVDLQKIIKDDRSVIDPRTGNRNEFLRGVGRKLDLTVTGFNAFRTDPQLKQIRADLGDRAEKSTITGAKGIVISCPDPQLQMALRGVVRAIDQLPELEKPKIAAVEGSEATIEAFRRLTTSFFGLLTFRMPPSADELRELQKKAVQSVEGSGQSGQGARTAFVEQAAGLAKRDYVPLAVAIFVDLCLLLVSIGRPVNRFMNVERSMREAENGPVYPILARFHEIHGDSEAVKKFEIFRDVIFDVNGSYHVAVPLNIPKGADNREELRRESQVLANLCYALEGQGILTRPVSLLPPLVAQRALKKRGSKFVECYGRHRPPRYKRGWQAVRSVWAETPHVERPAFKIYKFRKGAWPEMILHAVMGAARHMEETRGRMERDDASSPPSQYRHNGHGNGRAAPVYLPDAPPLNHAAHPGDPHVAAYGRYAPYVQPGTPPGSPDAAHGNGHAPNGSNGAVAHISEPQRQPAQAPAEGAGAAANGDARPASLKHALVRLLAPANEPAEKSQGETAAEPASVEVEKISGWFRRPKGNA
jgi:hypothetical protein